MTFPPDFGFVLFLIVYSFAIGYIIGFGKGRYEK